MISTLCAMLKRDFCPAQSHKDLSCCPIFFYKLYGFTFHI